jgi:hypothetical protein
MSHRRPLVLVWRRRTLDLVPESYFIERVLLGELGRPVRVIAVEEMEQTPFLDDAVIVSMNTEFAPYLAEARRRGTRRLALFHLGDEQGTDDKAFYSHADLVFRNYWFEAIAGMRNVFWMPNGYALGVGPAAPNALLAASQRPTAGFFAGALEMRQLSHERREMREAVEKAAVGFDLRFTARARDRLGPSAYAAHLGAARFALVPGGNSPETIRLYDALEMGAVPIMLRSPYVDAEGALNGPPFPLLKRWSDFGEVYAPFAGTSAPALAALDALQAHVVQWWTQFKRKQQQKMRTLIDRLMED